MIDFLRKYNKDIHIVDVSTLDQNKDKTPNYWFEALAQLSIEKKINVILSEWAKFKYEFASVIEYLINNLVDVDLVHDNDDYSLIYSIKNLEGNIIYYEGRNPCAKKKSDDLELLWQKVPSSIRSVYDNLHNGWVYYASQSNGILPVENLLILGDNDWGILDEITEDKLPFKLKNCIGFFHNGMGDYVAIDIESKDENSGFIWWNKKAPRLNIEFWPVVDEWTRMSIER